MYRLLVVLVTSCLLQLTLGMHINIRDPGAQEALREELHSLVKRQTLPLGEQLHCVTHVLHMRS